MYSIMHIGRTMELRAATVVLHMGIPWSCAVHRLLILTWWPQSRLLYACKLIQGPNGSLLWGLSSVQFSSVTQSCPTLWIHVRPHESQHARLPCPSPTPRVHSDSRPSSQWCHPAISSSVVPISSYPQPLPASGSFPMSQLFTWGGQSTGVSASAS